MGLLTIAEGEAYNMHWIFDITVRSKFTFDVLISK